MSDKFKVIHRDDVGMKIKTFYGVEVEGDQCKISWDNESEYMYYAKNRVEEYIKEGTWIVMQDENEIANEKLKKDFITLEKNYESLWEENEKLKKQLEDKDKYIQRLNLEAQRWFDNCMDLMHPSKETE